jgi:DNA repair and recombination protein RAD54 and RAD54-like protein
MVVKGHAPKLQLSNSVNSVVSSDGDLSSDSESEEETPEFLPHEPLFVWHPTSEGAAQGEQPIQVPTVLAQFLRPHQRAGVEFCSECLLGMKEFDGNGCILADDMGLGKTLQSIATMYTLMRAIVKPGDEGKLGKPMVKRTIVVCPCSLVNNWAQEFEKWVNSRVKTEPEKIRACAIAATDKKSVTFSIAQFLHPSHPFDVMVISYETFRMYVKKFTKKNDMCCDLLICDEAHRLKNPDALTTKALASLACRRRVLLSGTPVQNDLDEFFAMADFTNPGVLGTADEFRKHYKNPILVS